MSAPKKKRWGTLWPWMEAPLPATADQDTTTYPLDAGAAPLFALPPLPYSAHVLEPFISVRTMSYHYGKHHQTYVNNLNKSVTGTSWAGQSLEAIVKQTRGVLEQSGLFHSAAQVWSHTFFWNSMKGGGGSRPGAQLLEMLGRSFGGFEPFKKAFVEACLAQVGNGWVWLVQDGARLKLSMTSNTDTPLAHDQTALLTCDVWEHAYYLDYQNRRKDFVQMFVEHLANWDFAESQLR